MKSQWKHGDTVVRRSLMDLIMEGKKNPEEMKNELLLYKRENKEKSENYTGISLLCTAYKVNGNFKV